MHVNPPSSSEHCWESYSCVCECVCGFFFFFFTQAVQWAWSVLSPEAQKVPYGLSKSTCADCCHPAESPVQPEHEPSSMNTYIHTVEWGYISILNTVCSVVWSVLSVYCLTVPGGAGSAPVWRQHSHHVGPWTPHPELHIWTLGQGQTASYDKTHSYCKSNNQTSTIIV